MTHKRWVQAHPKGWAVRDQRDGYSIVISIHQTQASAMQALLGANQ